MDIKNKHHILVVDDDYRINELLSKFLKRNNYLISTASNVFEAKKLMEYFIFDLLIVDVMMPSVTGIEFTDKVKKHTKNIPIILLTALSAPEDKVKGLSVGADDYVTKPFEPKELILRIKNLIELYYYQKEHNNIIHFGNKKYEYQKRILLKENVSVKVTAAELKLLEIFISNAGQVISRKNLAEKMGGINERSVDVQVIRLRNKIEDDPKNPRHLQTIRNEGYIFYA